MPQARRNAILVCSLVAVALLGFLMLNLERAGAQSPVEPSSLDHTEAGDVQFSNCRTGIGVVNNPMTTYPVGPFSLGWFVDWRVEPVSVPTGVQHYATIRVKQDTISDGVYLPTYRIRPALTMSAGGLGPIVQTNPGKVWLVGNEPDIATQDGTEPEIYAEMYYRVYHFIKGIDPTAKVAIGATVQPTPLRLQYMDRVLSAYRARYGVKLPVDVWNTHLYISQEKRWEWGVKIPVGIDDVDQGVLYELNDAVDVAEFQSLVMALRGWMKARGYQNVPLIITEWGGLYPLWFLDDGPVNVTAQDFHKFVRDAIAFMSTARDPNLGYPGDDYRLVQRSAFWSLDGDNSFDNGDPKFGPPLFESASPYAMTLTGMYYRDVIAPAYGPEVDLAPYSAWSDHESIAPGSSGTVSVTLKTIVSNAGNTSFGTTAQVQFVNVTNGSNIVLGSTDLLPFTGCGTMREVSLPWPDVEPGVYRVRVKVDAANSIGEVNETNNETTITVIVGADVFLPLTSR